MNTPIQQNIALPDAAHDSERLKDAQRAIGTAMGWCIGVWFAPIISGLLCNEIEKTMVRNILMSLRGSAPSDLVNELFWCCRKKLFGLNIATYVPFAGASFQLLEVYALGQFTIRFAAEPSCLNNGKRLSESWQAIASEIFSGERVVSSYEEFTGKEFPTSIKTKFIPAVNAMRDVYARIEQIPGVMPSQEFAGEITRWLLNTGKKVLVRLGYFALEKVDNDGLSDREKNEECATGSKRQRAMSAGSGQ